MKVLVVAILCTLAAVQGRSAFGEFAAPGENPYVVHIRLATSDGNGLLKSCAGSLIDSVWVLSSAECVKNSRYMWLRFGAVDVVRPELVVEGNLIASVQGDLALIKINRAVDDFGNISRVALAADGSELPAAGKFCGFGAENNAPGSQLSCSNITLEASENGIVASSDGTRFDLGAPLVNDGVQVGVLVSVGESSVFASVTSNRAWIKEVTGV